MNLYEDRNVLFYPLPVSESTVCLYLAGVFNVNCDISIHHCPVQRAECLICLLMCLHRTRSPSSSIGMGLCHCLCIKNVNNKTLINSFSMGIQTMLCGLSSYNQEPPSHACAFCSDSILAKFKPF